MAGEIAKGFLDIEVRVGDSVKSIRQITNEVNAFQLSLNSASEAQADFAKKYTGALKSVANSSGVFVAETVKIRNAASVMDKTLSKGQATLGQFFSAKFNKNGAIAAEVAGLARERVSALGTAVVATTRSMNGLQEVIKVKRVSEFSEASVVAAQKQQILSTMLKQGTTNLINFGKNVQWAGRQLMVGFTVPLTIFGNTAGRVFMDLEKQFVGFKKVYGDIFTTPTELNQNLQAVTNLAKEYTKYGVAVKDTVGLAAQAAAAGRKNADLTDAVSQATRLATLGQMDQNAALETTISLQSAFRLSGQELADTINFLNMVENQTVVSLQDLSAAIPRVAPVIQGLGGDVKDLAVFLAAMQEGGVDAAEGANALKSGLASLINPTKQATQMLSGMGINLQAIIEANKGDLMGTVMSFSQALSALDQFSRQQALEQVFGKFQYAKLGALFDNISRQGSQAQQVIATMGYTTEQLGATADKELKTIEESFGVQLTGAIERFKLAIAPIGELFVKNAIPIINMFAKIAEGFNSLSDGKKQFITIATAIVGIVIPAGTMLLGLFMNLTGTITKFVSIFGTFVKNILTGNLKKAFQDLGGGAKYLSLEEIEAAQAAQQLSQASEAVSMAFQKQIAETDILTVAVNNLARALGGLNLAQMRAASGSPELYRTATAAASAAKGIRTGGAGFRVRRNAGGPIVPGVGNTDTVPAMLTPGEFVVNKDATKKNFNLLNQINSGRIKGFNKGGKVPGVQYFGGTNPGGQVLDAAQGLDQMDSLINNIVEKAVVSNTEKIFDPSETASLPRALNQIWNNFFRAKSEKSKSYKIRERLKEIISSFEIPEGDKQYLIGSLDGNYNVSGKEEQNIMGKAMRIFWEDSANQDVISRMSPKHKKTFIVAMLASEKTSKTPLTISQTSAGKGFGVVALPKGKRAGADAWGAKSKIAAYESFISGFGGEQGINKVIKEILNDPISRAVGLTAADLESRFGTTVSGSAKKPGMEMTHISSPKSRFRGFRLKKNSGGRIPGSGNTDTVPAMLTPGEFVVNKDATARNLGLLKQINGSSNTGSSASGIQNFKLGGMALPLLGNVAAGAMFMSNNPLMGTAGFVLSNLLPMLMSGGRGRDQGGDNTPVKFMERMKLSMSSATNALKSIATIGGRISAVAGGTVAAFAALGFGLYKLNKHLAEQEKAGSELTKAMYGSADKTRAMGEAFGRESRADAARRLAAERAGGQQITQEAQFASGQFMESDAGKKLVEDIKLVKSEGKNAIEALRNQLATSIIAGVITTEEARAIALDIGKQLNDQGISVGVSAELTKLLGTDGKDILKDLSSITAQISPKINKEDVTKQAETAFGELNFGERIGQLLMRGGKQGFVENYLVEQIASANAAAFEVEAQALATLNAAYQEGTVKLSEYNSQKAQIQLQSSRQMDINAQALGFENQQQLNQSLTLQRRTKMFGGTELVFQGSKEAEKVINEQMNAVQEMIKITSGSETVAKKTVQDAMSLGPQIFSDMLGGKVTAEDIPIMLNLKTRGDITYDEMIKFIDKVNILRNIPDIDKYINFNMDSPEKLQQGYDIISKIDALDTPINKEMILKTTGLDLAQDSINKILALPEKMQKELLVKINFITSGMTTATNANVREGRITQETLDNAAQREIDKMFAEFQKDPNKGISDKTGGGGSATDWKKNLQNRFDLVDKRLSLEAQKYQDIISLQERKNDLDRRSIELNNRALNELSKQEDAINNSYQKRISLLDEVASSNDRLRQQEQSRISFATALASGDIAGAASQMAEITNQNAAYRIEDARAALEVQKEQDIKNLKVEINGELLTRQDIEARIDSIEETIYQRSLLIRDAQDSIYAIEEQRLQNSREREKVETRMYLLEQQRAITELKRMAAGRKGGKLSGEERAALESYKTSYNQMAAFYNQTFGDSIPQMNAFGGKIRKMAFGGMAYKGSNEMPPPLKMAFGNIVPGLGNTDRVPALLTPGEFVVRKSVARANMPLLEMLNNGITGPSYNVPSSDFGTTKPSIQQNTGIVYNDTYSINVNVSGTNASPDEIANAVINRLSQFNSGNVRGIRY